MGPTGRVPLDVVREIAACVRRDTGWGVRPVVRADVVDDAVELAVSGQLPDAWVVRVPAGRPLQESIDAALRQAAPAAPDTPRYDALTAVVWRPAGTTKTDGPIDRRRGAARRERWKALLEPITLLWIGVATLGATMMSAADVKEFGRGDAVWTVGGSILLSGVVAVVGHLVVAAWRLVRWSIRAAPTEQELARALLRDLRYDWQRLLPNGLFRARDVPYLLPVLLIDRAPADPEPTVPSQLPATARSAAAGGQALLDAYHRWHSPRLPLWLWQFVAFVRRPSAVVVTDCPLPDHVPVAEHLPAALVSWWRSPQSPTRYLLGAVARAVGRVLERMGRWLGRMSRRFVAAAVPAGARRRAERLLTYGVIGVLLSGSLYLDRSADQPYCLWRIPGSHLSTDTSADEWVGYRTCLGWWQLAEDIRDNTVTRVANRLTVHRAGPDDNPHLFDVDLIYRENKRVERLADEDRPLLTVAVVTSLTSADPAKPIRSVVAERENLAGAYAAQLRINSMRSTRHPYVRLAVVNAGDLTLGDADTAVKDHLATLESKLHRLAEDPALAAAIVGVNSTRGVQNVLRNSLGAAGVAMVSPTMSADGFGAGFGGSPVFFQVNSTNDDQVQLIYEYARKRGRSLTYFYPVRDKRSTREPKRTTDPRDYGVDENDLYVTSLYCDVQRRDPRPPPAVPDVPPDGRIVPCPPTLPPPPSPAVGRPKGGPADSPPTVELVPWSAELQLTNVAAKACPADGGGTRAASAGRDPEKASSGAEALPLVFFGGRYPDVAEFTQALRLACGPRAPEVAVADSSARFLADRELARHVPHGVKVLISYRGRVLTCDTLRHPQQEPGEWSFNVGRRADFYDDVSGSLHRCAGSGDPEADRWLAGGWAAFSYDSLLMIDDAMLRAGLPEATDARARILHCLRGPDSQPVTEQCDSSTGYPGAYGTIHLHRGVGRRSAVLLRVNDLATAFESPGTVDTVGTCTPDLPARPEAEPTPCTADIPPEGELSFTGY